MVKGHLKEQLRKNRIKAETKKTVIVAATAALAITALSTIVYMCSSASITSFEKEFGNIGDSGEVVTLNMNDVLKKNLEASMQMNISTVQTDITASPSEVESEEKAEAETVEAVAAKDLIEPGTFLYTDSIMNVRADASTDADILGKLQIGSKIEVISDTGTGWVEINFKDNKGYLSSEYLIDSMPLIKVSSTAYYDQYHRTSASGRPLREKHSVAGMVKWLGRQVNVYECNDDGSVGEFRGTYTFDDTGYGAESGYGSSKILEGRTVGTIENGTCIDFYMNTASQCTQYGRHNIYIQFVE